MNKHWTRLDRGVWSIQFIFNPYRLLEKGGNKIDGYYKRVGNEKRHNFFRSCLLLLSLYVSQVNRFLSINARCCTLRISPMLKLILFPNLWKASCFVSVQKIPFCGENTSAFNALHRSKISSLHSKFDPSPFLSWG